MVTLGPLSWHTGLNAQIAKQLNNSENITEKLSILITAIRIIFIRSSYSQRLSDRQNIEKPQNFFRYSLLFPVSYYSERT